MPVLGYASVLFVVCFLRLVYALLEPVIEKYLLNSCFFKLSKKN